MTISTVTWQAIIAGAIEVGHDVDLALTAGAVLGVPEAGVVEPFVAILEGLLVKAKAAAAGNLSVVAAAVVTADAAAAAAEAAKFPPGT